MKSVKKISLCVVTIVLLVINSISGKEGEEKLSLEEVRPEHIRVNKIIKLIEEKGGFSKTKWSPNGKWIAFRKPKGQNIIVLDVKSRNKLTIKVSDTKETAWGFSWSPDGNKIAFNGNERVNGNKVNDILGIVKIESKEGKLNKETIEIIDRFKENIGRPVWSQSGVRLYFEKKGKETILDSRILSNFKSERNIYPILLTKNNKILEKDKKIFLEDATTKKKITNYGYNPEILEDERIRYQIDTNLFVVTDGVTREIYSRLETGHTYLKNGKLIDETNIFFVEKSNYTVSPFGEFLVYADTKDDGHRYISSDLKIKKIGEIESYSLTNTPDVIEIEPSWSPEGKRIIFKDEISGKESIYMMELEIK